MGHVNTVFHQILALIPRNKVDKLVEEHGGDHYVKRFDTWSHLVMMLFAQATGKDSLRDLEATYNAHQPRLYHLGAKPAPRSTLADANKRRPWQIFQELYSVLLERCRSLTPKHSFRFKNPLFTIDSTVIDLCLSVFPWAKFRKRKGAIKMHCRQDHSGLMPDIIIVTDGKRHDVKMAPHLTKDLIPDSIVSFDKAYIDFKWLNSLTNRGVFFVTRAKENLDYSVVGQHDEPEKNNIISDEIIKLNGPKSASLYPQELRLVKFRDYEKNKTYVFITNNFDLAASTIAAIYKARWMIELLFKWIKQNLKIKSFLGTSKNAVLTQIWAAMIYYMLLSYLKLQSRYKYSLHTLTEIIGATLFHRVSLFDLLSLNKNSLHKLDEDHTLQLLLPMRL